MNTYGEVYEIRSSAWLGELDTFRGYDRGDAARTDESELLDTFDNRDSAIWNMNHKLHYMNEILLDPIGVHVYEKEMYAFPLDDRGLVDDSEISEPWIADYQSERTVVTTIKSWFAMPETMQHTVFNTFAEAKAYALGWIERGDQNAG